VVDYGRAKNDCALTIAAKGRPMKTVCKVPGMSRSNLAVKSRRQSDEGGRRKTPTMDGKPRVAELQELVADLPTFGYRRVWALLRRRRDSLGYPTR
jgi:putative transposase